MGIRVRAIEIGYYGHRRRREGEVFELVDRKDRRGRKDEKGKIITVMKAEDQFSKKWMIKVDRNAKTIPAFNEADGRIANRMQEANENQELESGFEDNIPEDDSVIVSSNQEVI